MRSRFVLGLVAACVVLVTPAAAGADTPSPSAVALARQAQAALPSASGASRLPSSPSVSGPKANGNVRTIVVASRVAATPPGLGDYVAPTAEQFEQADQSTDAIAAVNAVTTQHEGCVVNTTYYPPRGPGSISWRGDMLGCAWGTLQMHSYIRYGGTLEQDGNNNTCFSARGSCAVAMASCPCSLLGYHMTVVHGWNVTTGGSSYASLEIYRYVE